MMLLGILSLILIAVLECAAWRISNLINQKDNFKIDGKIVSQSFFDFDIGFDIVTLRKKRNVTIKDECQVECQVELPSDTRLDN